MSTEILVYADWFADDAPVLVGTLTADTVRGREQFRFSYDDDWLSSENAQSLDPQLELYGGDQFANDGGNFRVFLDSCPDRWGRLLMKRREAVRANEEKRKPRTLMESDYLLGVNDLHRMGALRFKTDANGPFLDDDEDMHAPPMARLRELEFAAHQVEQKEDLDDKDYLQWLKLLISPGSSLGGARPKANVIDEEGRLWIAKFPSRNDDHNVGLWERVTADLAYNAGVLMAPVRAERLAGEHHTFLTQRFDRQGEQRLNFSSAMTQLGYDDGEQSASYLELAEFLTKHGSNTSEDLAQLWRRIVFNIAVSNTDDHLRNHGFILEESGWRLSPAYDINPEPTGAGLHLFISDKDNRLDFDLAMSVVDFFQMSDGDATLILDEVRGAVAGWLDIAKASGLSQSECEAMSPAFNA